VLAWITVDHATALKATHKAGRRGGDSIARKHGKMFNRPPGFDNVPSFLLFFTVAYSGEDGDVSSLWGDKLGDD